MDTFLYIILGILLLTVLYIISIYNKLVPLKNRMQEAWSGIDVFLKKRHDLIPNLVETVKGYAAHEKQTLEDIIRCRSGAMSAKSQEERIAMEKELGNALMRLNVVSEHYPELKANTNFLTLQRQLAEMEEELALARRYYNGTVRENNIKIESFPSNIIAGWFNFAKGLFFEIDKHDKVVPNVSF